MNLIEQLLEFWRHRLADNEYRSIGDQFGRVCDIAYMQLQQLAAQRGRKSQP